MSTDGRPPLGEDPPLKSRIENELRFHEEALVSDLVQQGWEEDAARAEARRRFGDPERVERALLRLGRRKQRMMRRRGWLGAVVQDVGFALRQMRRNPSHAVATVLVLALGIGVSAAVFAVVDVALFRSLPFPEADRLVAVHDVQDGPGYPASLPEVRDWKREGDFLEGIVAFSRNNSTLQEGDLPQRVLTGLVEGDLFGVTGTRPILGRGFTPEELAAGGGALLIDEDYWRARFEGDPAVIGRSLRLNGESVPVVGVVPAETQLLFSSNDIVLYRPMPDLPDVLTRGLHFLTVVGRVADGASFPDVRARAEAMAEGLRAEGITRHGVVITPLREHLLGETRRTVLILAGAVVLVLFVVSANLAHLSLARGWSRAREIAVRSALGAGRGRLVRQLLTESALHGLLGGLGALAIAWWTTAWVARATGEPVVATLASGLDARVIAFAVLAALGAGFLFGWVPARRTAGLTPARALRGARGARLRTRARHVLVGAEVALSAVLLTGAGLLVRTVSHLVGQDPGFEPRGVLTMELALGTDRYPGVADRVLFWDELLTRVRALPGVEEAGLVSEIPLTGDTNGGFEIVGREFPEGEGPWSRKRFAGVGYFEVMEIPLLRGRTFSERDRLGEPEVAVVSARLAELYWPNQDPIGQRIRFLWQTEAEQEIVGIVGDVRTDALDQAEALETIYLSHHQIAPQALSLAVRADGDPERLVEPIRRTVLEIDPQQPVHGVATLPSLVRSSVSGRTTIMTLLTAFGVLALLLAAVGVYAVAAQSVAGRTREIGVRLAVGAEPGRVARSVLREEMVPVAVGLAVGLLGAAASGRVLADLLYEVDPSDPGTLLAVAAVLGAAAAAALVVPAVRALRVDPVRVLTSE